MYEIKKMGEHSLHDELFSVDRENGYPWYLFLLLDTPGEFFIDGSWQCVKENSIIIFEPGQRHLYGPVRDSGNGYGDSWIHIISKSPLLGKNFPYGKPIHVPEIDRYKSILHVLAMEYFGNSSNKESIINHLLKAMLEMFENDTKDKNYGELYYHFLEIRRKIYQYPEKQWKVENIAKDLGLSTGYFQVNYKKFFGNGCNLDIITARLDLACELLSSTDRSVEEIAENCGYNYKEHFIRQFKDRMNCTPLQFRKENINF